LIFPPEIGAQAADNIYQSRSERRMIPGGTVPPHGISSRAMRHPEMGSSCQKIQPPDTSPKGKPSLA
jgi:hypothetical protein